jgi:hypothetical protein
MNTVLAIAVGGVMLVLVGRSLVGLITEAKGLDARNRRLAILTLALIVAAAIATFIIVRAARVG